MAVHYPNLVAYNFSPSLSASSSNSSGPRVAATYDAPRMPEGHPAEQGPTNHAYSAFIQALQDSSQSWWSIKSKPDKPQITQAWQSAPAIEWAAGGKSWQKSSLITALKQFNEANHVRPLDVVRVVRNTVHVWNLLNNDRLAQAARMICKAIYRTPLLSANNPDRLSCAKALLVSMAVIAETLPHSWAMTVSLQEYQRIGPSLECLGAFARELTNSFDNDGVIPELAAPLSDLARLSDMTLPEKLPDYYDFNVLTLLTEEAVEIKNTFQTLASRANRHAATS